MTEVNFLVKKGLTVPKGSASTPSVIFDASDPNTGLYSPGADQVAVATNGTQRITVDASGRLLVGTSSAINTDGSSLLQVVGTSSGALLLARNDTETLSGDQIGAIRFFGNDTLTSGGYEECAAIKCIADADHTDSSKASRLAFFTTPSGAESPTERLRITSAGLVGIGTSSPSAALDVVGSGKFSEGLTCQNETYMQGSLTTTQRYLNFQDSGTSNYRATLRRDAWYLGSPVTNIGDVTPSGANIVLKMTGDATFAGSVGIGTSSPDQALSVGSGAADTRMSINGTGQYQLKFTNSGAAGFWIGSPGANSLAFAQDDGTTRMTIDSSGRLGIGTTSPNSKLAVSNGGAESFEFYPADASNVNKINYYNRSGAVYCDAVQNAASHQFAIQGTEKARLDSSGRLLVGTSSSPTGGDAQYSKLVVKGYVGDNTGYAPIALMAGTNGASLASGNGIGRIEFCAADSASFAQITASVDGTTGSNDYPGRLTFSTTADGASSPTERMRITNKGHVGIGVVPGVPLHVLQATDNASGNPVASFSKGYAGDLAHAILHLGKTDNNSTTSQVFQRFYINNAATGSGMITANGASQAAFTSFSDARLKENIQDLPNQLDAICALRPVEFDYKDGSGHQIGFIAQEVEQIYPDLIGKADDEMLTVSGLGKYEARLIKAIQELKDELDAAKQRIAVLETQ
jgi:hypothetical protein